MYRLGRNPVLDKKLSKLSKKDPVAYEAVKRKVRSIATNPFAFKPLSNSMKNIRRVHIKKSFVLTYEINVIEKTVVLLDFDHHDKIYK